MGLFNIFKKKNNAPEEPPKLSWEESIKLLNEDKISLQEFININAGLPVYYSTPIGENNEGQPILWLIKIDEPRMDFYPAFLSKELCYEHFTSAGRKDFLVIEGNLKSALSSLDTSAVLKRAGLMLFDKNGRLAIPPRMRVRK